MNFMYQEVASVPCNAKYCQLPNHTGITKKMLCRVCVGVGLGGIILLVVFPFWKNNVWWGPFLFDQVFVIIPWDLPKVNFKSPAFHSVNTFRYNDVIHVSVLIVIVWPYVPCKMLSSFRVKKKPKNKQNAVVLHYYFILFSYLFRFKASCIAIMSKYNIMHMICILYYAIT